MEDQGSEDQGGAFTADIDYSLAASTGGLTRGLFSRRHVVLTKSFQLVEVYSVRENGRDALVKVAHYPDKGLHTARSSSRFSSPTGPRWPPTGTSPPRCERGHAWKLPIPQTLRLADLGKKLVIVIEPVACDYYHTRTDLANDTLQHSK